MGNVTAGAASEGEDDETEFLEVRSIELRHDHANAIFVSVVQRVHHLLFQPVRLRVLLVNRLFW